jgi:DNA-binding NarL/FixJ family response regulator
MSLLDAGTSNDDSCSHGDGTTSVLAWQADRAIRDEAIAQDAISTASMPLASLWEGLKQGVCRVVDTFFTRTRCFVITAGVAHHAGPALYGPRLRIVEQILTGRAQMTIAVDLEKTPATISVHAKLGLRSLGIDGKPSRVHPLIMLAAKAARERDTSVVGSVCTLFPNGVSLRAVAVPRPDAHLAQRLAAAQLAVAQGLIEGLTHKDLACRRGTSRRTIANQVAGIYRRWRVTDRNDLVHRLFAECDLRSAGARGA